MTGCELSLVPLGTVPTQCDNGGNSTLPIPLPLPTQSMGVVVQALHTTTKTTAGLATTEFVSNILLRPFALAIRLFANMLAGHMLLVTFAILTDELVSSGNILGIILSVLPFGMLMFITAFEVLVGFLQAYIFTILTAVFIASSMAGHEEPAEPAEVH